MKMPEAPVIIAGSVFRTVPTQDDNGVADGGLKVALMSGDGATEIKYKPRDVQNLGGVVPIPGDSIALVVRPFPWNIDGNSGVSFQYVSPVDQTTLDDLFRLIEANKAKSAK